MPRLSSLRWPSPRGRSARRQVEGGNLRRVDMTAGCLSGSWCWCCCCCRWVHAQSVQLDDGRVLSQLQLQQVHARTVVAALWRRVDVLVQQRLHVRAQLGQQPRVCGDGWPVNRQGHICRERDSRTHEFVEHEKSSELRVRGTSIHSAHTHHLPELQPASQPLFAEHNGANGEQSRGQFFAGLPSCSHLSDAARAASLFHRSPCSVLRRR